MTTTRPTRRKHFCFNLSLITICCIAVLSCKNSSSDFDPRDTVQVPEGLTGEDSIAYIENAITISPISAADLLNLTEVHTLDSWFEEWRDYGDGLEMTHRDSCALRLANRFMRMHHLVDINGDAMDKLQWAQAVGSIIDSFCSEVPCARRDTTIYDILRLFDKFSAQKQADMNLECYVMSSIDYYRTIDAYREWLEKAPNDIKALAKEEYKAWHDLNEARFTLWRDVYFTQEWYSMKPLEIEGYYRSLSENRRAELDIEKDIILKGSKYAQQGKTVTTPQWEQWIKKHSQPMDYNAQNKDDRYENYPSDSTITECVTAIRKCFSSWLAARQKLAAALPDDRGTSYDNLTADIHSRIVGKLKPIIPYTSVNGDEYY